MLFNLFLIRIHAQTLLTNQPSWLNYPNTLDPNTLQVSLLVNFESHFLSSMIFDIEYYLCRKQLMGHMF